MHVLNSIAEFTFLYNLVSFSLIQFLTINMSVLDQKQVIFYLQHILLSIIHAHFPSNVDLV